ncbi:MAG TPA: HlyD family efflux transporter periplasmic adaptor subunit [Gemmataceae bacterium]|nr:HlyD family efflux transporter periplasmic adaptor subunit [Gemmataceae bacterium]
MKKWLLLLVVLALAGGAAYWWWGRSGPQPLTEKVLTFGEVRQATIRDIVSATGMVEPREIVVVTSETPGTVLRLMGHVGKTVVDGEPLAQLDDRRIALKVKEAQNGIQLADAAVAQARAALTQAEANKAAAERVLKVQNELAGATGFRTEREQALSQVQAAEAGIKAAEAGIKAAVAKQLAAKTSFDEADLSHKLMLVKVPDSIGNKREFLVLERKVQEGQMVGPQSGPLFTLAGSLDHVEVHAQVAEGDINKIKTRLKALFKITNYRDEDTDFEGRVKEIRPLASTIKGAVYYDAVLNVENRRDASSNEWLLRPGMTTSVDIVRYERVNAWRVPVSALNFKLEEAYQDADARAQLAAWKQRPDEADWRVLWTWDQAARRAHPVFIRVNSKPGEEPGLKDAEGVEVLEWEPGKTPSGPLRVIIGAPPAKAPGFFDQPANVKI